MKRTLFLWSASQSASQSITVREDKEKKKKKTHNSTPPNAVTVHMHANNSMYASTG